MIACVIQIWNHVTLAKFPSLYCPQETSRFYNLILVTIRNIKASWVWFRADDVLHEKHVCVYVSVGGSNNKVRWWRGQSCCWWSGAEVTVFLLLCLATDGRQKNTGHQQSPERLFPLQPHKVNVAQTHTHAYKLIRTVNPWICSLTPDSSTYP